MQKRNIINSIMSCKCPRCRQGDMFDNVLSYDLRKLTDMKEECEVCGLKFTPEIGFYYGGMYVSYAFAIMQCIAVAVLSAFLAEPYSTWVLMGGIPLVLLLMTPLNFRWGRSGWISIFYRYDEKYARMAVNQG